MSNIARKLRVAVAAGLAAVTLSASVAFACNAMQGQAYLDTVNGAPYVSGLPVLRGSVVGMHADGLRLDYHDPAYPVIYRMLEDNQGTYCEAGNSADIGQGQSWQGSTKIGAGTSPVHGILMSGSSWKGHMILCFGDGYQSSWPVILTAI